VKALSLLRPRVGVVLAVAIGCEATSPATQPTTAELPEGTAAVVGEDRVQTETVRRIARAEACTLLEARELAIRDASLAAEARRRFAGTGRIASAETSALARSLLEQIQRETSRAPVTDEEVTEATGWHWQQLDRPASVRTTHAVVLVKDPSQDAGALALARRVAEATAGATDPKEFERRATAVPADGHAVKVEHLPPVTADGRIVALEPGGPPSTATFDPEFARAANALRVVGEQSPVIKSAFGYHVILLEERLEARTTTLEERRSILHDEILDQRARGKVDQVLAAARRGTSIEVSRAAGDLTKRVLSQR